jgi:predicted DNA-binding protein (MmcQ/YjbR family)
VSQLRAFGLRYPGAHTKSPWPGHLDLAVKDKTFAYLSADGDPVTISCKLPRSSDAALSLPFTTPTAYGLGKSGWVTASFAEGSPVPIELLEQWIDESYRAQAPKRLSAAVPEGGPSDVASAPTVEPPRPRAAPPRAPRSAATQSPRRGPVASARAGKQKKRAARRSTAAAPAPRGRGVSKKAKKRRARV